jgi:hypothetical protein
VKTLLLLVFLSLAAFAQTQSATTVDGEKVASLSIEAALIYQSGDVKPVARTVFYLLDADPIEILKKTGVQPVRSGEAALDADPARLVFSLARIQSSLCPDCERFRGEAIKAIAPHIIKTATTGFDGRASFEGVKPGTYHFYGVWSVGQNNVLWSHKQELKAGAMTLKLDQNNAAIAL